MQKPVLLVITFFIMFIVTQSLQANQQQIDSLKLEISKTNSDTLKAQIYLGIADLIYYESTDSMFYYSKLAYQLVEGKEKESLSRIEKKAVKLIQALAFNNIGSYYNDIGQIDTALYLYEKAFDGFEEFNEKEGMAISANNIGYIYNNFKVDIPKAITYYKKSISYLKELEADVLVANLLNNLAYVYDGQGDFQSALEMYFESLKIYEKTNNRIGIGQVYNNIGALYQDLEDIELAEDYYNRSLEVRREVADSLGVGYVYNNLAHLFMGIEDYQTALQYHLHALKVRQALNRPREISQSLGNIGLVLIYQEKYDSALMMLNQAVEINETLGDEEAQAASLGNLGMLYYKKKDWKKAMDFANQSYEISKRNQFEKYLRSSSELLYKVHKELNNDGKALFYFENYVQLKDSALSADNIKESMKLQSQYEIEKEALIQQQKQKEAEEQARKQKSRRNNIQYSLILISLLIMAGLILTLGVIKVSERQAQGLIFLAFLIFFEFLLVILDPYVDNFSEGAPLIKLLVNVVVAALIFPVHEYFEKSLQQRILKRKAH